MKKLRLYSIIGFFTVIISITNSKSAEYFTDKGSFWLEGSFTFFSLGFEGYDGRLNFLSLSPTVRFFPFKFVAIGPRFTWARSFQENYYNNQIGLGADIGFVYGKDTPVIPYFKTGYQFEINASQYDNVDRNSEIGGSVPFGLGLIIPIKGIIAIQIEPSFQLIWGADSDNVNIFSISIGFCGIGKKTAISFTQSLPYIF